MDELGDAGDMGDAGDIADGDAVEELDGFETGPSSSEAPFLVDFEHSGHRPVDDVLDRLTRLPDTELPGHADVYDAIHNDLRAILADQPAGAQGPGSGR